MLLSWHSRLVSKGCLKALVPPSPQTEVTAQHGHPGHLSIVSLGLILSCPAGVGSTAPLPQPSAPLLPLHKNTHNQFCIYKVFSLPYQRHTNVATVKFGRKFGRNNTGGGVEERRRCARRQQGGLISGAPGCSLCAGTWNSNTVAHPLLPMHGVALPLRCRSEFDTHPLGAGARCTAAFMLSSSGWAWAWCIRQHLQAGPRSTGG